MKIPTASVGFEPANLGSKGQHATSIPPKPISQMIITSYKKDLNRLKSFLTPRGRVLIKNLTGQQLAKKFPAFYGTRRFITAFTIAHHLYLT
jgi:ribosomal protein S18